MRLTVITLALLTISRPSFAANCPDAGACNPTTQKSIIEALTGTARSCVNNNAGVNPQDACNVFVGAALRSAYNINDFFVASASHYYTSGELLKKLPLMKAWRELGTADSDSVLLTAQTDANAGYPVVAVTSGHVALIIPGTMMQSTTWKTCVPNSASESTDPNGPHYIGKRLSTAWQSDDKPSIQLWARTSP
jgi:hypothetical protein